MFEGAMSGGACPLPKTPAPRADVQPQPFSDERRRHAAAPAPAGGRAFSRGPCPVMPGPGSQVAEAPAAGRAFEELRAGNLGVRLARTPAETDASFAPRFRVFFEEMGARPDAVTAATRRDTDAFDAV